MYSRTKFDKITDWAKEQIDMGTFNPGDKFPSESELCKKFEVSRQPVRHALKILEQNGYVHRVQGSGTYVSETRPSPRAKVGTQEALTIGIISTHVDDYIFPGIIRGIERVLAAHGYNVLLAFSKNLIADETRVLNNILNTNVDGLIIEPTKSGLPCFNLELYRAIRKKNIPIVFIDSVFSEFPAPYVALDDENVGYEAAMHLLEMGHRDIMGVFSVSNRQGHLRYLGLLKALHEFGLPIRDDRIYWYSKENFSEILNGKQIMEGLLECTAAFCYNDQVALRLLELLKQNGRCVPRDVSLVGVDNSEVAALCSLTSIVHPCENLGEVAARLLLSIIKGEEERNILFPTKLIKRSSVKRI